MGFGVSATAKYRSIPLALPVGELSAKLTERAYYGDVV
jgi:hypothetical protein